MRAKEDAKNKPLQPIVRPGEGSDVERPAVPVAKGKDAGVGAGAGAQEMEEIPIAGRTKMTVPKYKDGAQVVVPQESSSEKAEVVVDHTEAKSELNDILKRSPGMFLFSIPCTFEVPVSPD